ncbi:molybdenum cofactor guanylyltransferase MobA [Inmirania thermothiophila]|uniref:Molybdenum cofactor guanylyltransferase n=1 Tax=Inmirania thermothiophila TaxID=1750597 RepID=A0A3N1Y0I7_9GAMM|nr:molybdenum cofactor guanylyltransferase MobA [Inmirania thermothiophila]ROR32320.1 molybdenum cofactor guanylyltransferase [Inmirania thermothiophila]
MSAAGVTGAVLAGGRGRRMGGRDKGLLELAGRPLAAHILDALRPQCEALLINANRNREAYEALGVPVVGDALAGFQGPLAGFAAALAAATTPLVATVPCDSPLVPPDLVARLRAALEAAGAEIAVAHDGRRLQPVFALLRRELLPSLEAYLAAGDRKIDLWYPRHRTVEVDFSDRPEAFMNANEPEQLAELAARVGAGGRP